MTDLPRPLFWMPQGAQIPGGYVAQFHHTAQAMTDLGCQVTEALVPELPTSGIDIVHGFGLGVEQVKSCHQRGWPVVMSTVYWDMKYRYDGPAGKLTARALAGRLRRTGRFAGASLRGRGSLVRVCMDEARYELDQKALYSSVDILLPNAVGEGRSLQADLDVDTLCRVVPNGVDPLAYSPGPAPFDTRDVVLFVGRIEPHKNQLGLLRALRDTGRRLVLAGYSHRDHPDYVEECRAAAAGWAEIIEGPTTEDLSALYRSARVHVLPSWFETTGLVSLEAGLSGCNVVTTDRGHAREYLGDLAWYCDPASPESMRRAVDEAWHSPPRPALRDRILDSYTWAHVGRATLAAYREALAMYSGT